MRQQGGNRLSNRAQIREEAKKLNPIDDLMFRKMVEDKDFCQEILRVILGDPKLIVVSNHPQHSLTNLQGRSVVLDAHCILGDESEVDIEVQKANDDDHQRRVRYNGSVLTSNIVDPGEKFRKVPNICVVFISRFDIFKKGLSVYHVDRVVRETGETVSNGFSEVYVSALVRDGSDVSELMKVFTEDASYNEKFPFTSKCKERYKKTKEGIEEMCDIMEALLQQNTQALKESLAEAKEEAKKFKELNQQNQEEAARQKARADMMEAQMRALGLEIPT